MNAEVVTRVQVHRALPPEEQARADFYALFARLFNAAPDAKLLATLAQSGDFPPDSDPALARAWDALVAASGAMDPDAAAEEYHALFEGVGAAEVSIYSAFYMGATSVDHPRVKIRADLASFGLARRDRETEPEDHWAGLLDAMRVLVAGGAGRAAASVSEQRRFYQGHLEPGVARFFKAVKEAGSANFYRKVAELGLAFEALESESFRLG
jgi:TorA maturation chaperone TorD